MRFSANTIFTNFLIIFAVVPELVNGIGENEPFNLFLLIDRSGSINQGDYYKMLDTLSNLPNVFSIQDGRVALFIAAFDRNGTHLFLSLQETSKVDAAFKLMKLMKEYGPKTDGVAPTNLALKYIHNTTVDANRQDKANATVILTGTCEPEENRDDAVKQAQMLRAAGHYIAVIYFGARRLDVTCKNHLEQIMEGGLLEAIDNADMLSLDIFTGIRDKLPTPPTTLPPPHEPRQVIHVGKGSTIAETWKRMYTAIFACLGVLVLVLIILGVVVAVKRRQRKRWMQQQMAKRKMDEDAGSVIKPSKSALASQHPAYREVPPLKEEKKYGVQGSMVGAGKTKATSAVLSNVSAPPSVGSKSRAKDRSAATSKKTQNSLDNVRSSKRPVDSFKMTPNSKMPVDPSVPPNAKPQRSKVIGKSTTRK